MTYHSAAHDVPHDEPTLPDMPQPSSRPRLPFTWQEAVTLVILLALLGVGYHLRAQGRNWDDYSHLHPDERFLTDVAGRLGTAPLNYAPNVEADLTRQALCSERYPAATQADLEGLTPEEQDYRLTRTGKGGYFDAQCSDLNPNNIGFGLYVYGQFPMFVTRVSAETITEVERDQCLRAAGEDEEARNQCQTTARTAPRETYNGIHFVGRMVSTLADTLAILLIFLITSKLVGRWPGLLAAGLYTFAAFPIQQSHFWTVDAFTSVWVLLGLLAAVNVLDNAASRPARYSPLIWIAAALGLWAWELPQFDEPTTLPLLIYLGVFSLTSLGMIWARQTGQPLYLAAGVVPALLGVALGLQQEVITPMGAAGAGALTLALLVGIALGMNRWAAYGGTFLWAMSAFGLWIYDSLAHYPRPSLTGLVIYGVIFAAGAFLASGLYGSKTWADRLLWVILGGVPLLIWTGLAVLSDAIAWQGGLSAALLVLMLVAATAYGYRDYAAFGVAFGLALAGRVNVAPMVGLLLLAVMIHYLPVLDRRLPGAIRYDMLARALTGLIIAGALTVIGFRFLQPHAFNGPSVFGIVEINPGWREDIEQAQYLVSGNSDIPPNHQWANRIPWLFPLQNIVLYGLGPAFGLMGVAGFLLALWRIARGAPGWSRLALPAAWMLVYFGWLGANWVSTMRYFLPIYGVLALFAGWLLVEIMRGAWFWQPNRYALRRLRPVAVGVGLVLLLVVPGYTAAYGYATSERFTKILSRVGVSVWFQENVPGDMGVWIRQPDGGFTLQNLATGRTGAAPVVTPLTEGESIQRPITLSADTQILSVALHRVTDLDRDSDEETIRVRLLRGDDPLVFETIAERTLTADLSQGIGDFGSEYSLRFDDGAPLLLPLLPPGSGLPANYVIEITAVEGNLAFARNVSDNVLPYNIDHLTLYTLSGDELPGTQAFRLDSVQANGATASGTTASALPPEDTEYTFYMPSQRQQVSFTAQSDGVLEQIEIPNVADPIGDADDETLYVEITGTNGETAYGRVTGNFLREDDGHHFYGRPASIAIDPPLTVQAGAQYTLSLTTDSPLLVLGTAVATEGPWDDPLPYNTCPLPEGWTLSPDTPSGYTQPYCQSIPLFGPYYEGLEVYLVAEDNDLKRSIMQDTLDRAEYLTVSSNRFYDTLSRIPYRWPMSMAYYDALFSGELGFELVLTWESYPELGGFVWKNQVLPTDDLPTWLNEFEAEEAFHVYDHPVVYVFRKTPDYDPARTAEILSVPIRQYTEALGGVTTLGETLPVNRNVLTAPLASDIPTGQMLTPAMSELQAATTWRDLFNPNAFINTNHTFTTLTWWLVIMGVGWLMFPLVFVIFRALPDRGFAVSKLVAWILIAWLAWMGAVFRLGTWSSGGIQAIIAGLAVINLIFAYNYRADFGGFLRARWRHLLRLELLTAFLFLAFLWVRLGNPDLWHSPFGGEKPMDFAYFNAVLRSQTFPPLDPWYAGGFINYYYWGFVLVGAPVKLLGILPALAYNLILPTLFAWVGMGAFSIAYNLAAVRTTYPQDAAIRRAPSGNPWIAGIAALLLTVVAGNLDTPRVFLNAVATQGGYAGSAGYDLETVRLNDALTTFRTEQGREPNLEERAALEEEAANIPVTTQMRYNIEQNLDLMEGFSDGLDSLFEGAPLTLSTHRWYWAPTRTIAELPGGRGHNAINEMPYFTFLYGDMHAHMMSMPLMLLVMLWLVSEVLGAGRGLRGVWGSMAALFIGGLTVGLLRATNTWDWPAFLILAVAGLTYVAWARQNRLRGDIPAIPFFERLQGYLDLPQTLRLWPFLLAIPVGLLLHSGLWLVGSISYEEQLTSNQIPQQCIAISQMPPDERPDTLPTVCEGKIEPVWQVRDAVIFGGGAFGAVVFLYMAAFVFFGSRFDQEGLLLWVGRVLAFAVVMLASVYPFTMWYAGDAGIELWEADRTPLWAFLNIHGLFLFILFSYLVWRTIGWLRDVRVEDVRGYSLPVLLALLGAPLTVIVAVLVGLFAVPVMLVTLPMIVWGMGLFLLPRLSHAERMILVAVVLALGLTTGVEIVRLNVDIGRQNTVFKFYMQAWLLLAVSSGVALAWLLESAWRWLPPVRAVWQFALAVMFVVAMLYPVMATQARWLDRFDARDTGRTLDGMAYMQHAVYGDNSVYFNFQGDYTMIQWLLENVEGTPTIVEAHVPEYRWGARISINTGLPAVIGWNWHQRQQRSIHNLSNGVWNRANNVTAFYNTTDIAAAWNLIEFYNMEYIILGTYERVVYNDLLQNLPEQSVTSGLNPGLAKFDLMVEMGLLEVVYEAPSCVSSQALSASECPPNMLVTDKIYRVVEGADYAATVSAPASEIFTLPVSQPGQGQ